MSDIYVNGRSLDGIFDEILNSFCQECAELALFHECDDNCDEYHLHCGMCI